MLRAIGNKYKHLRVDKLNFKQYIEKLIKVIDTTILTLVIDKKERKIKWNGGISSGWLLTSLLDSLVNLLYLKVTE